MTQAWRAKERRLRRRRPTPKLPLRWSESTMMTSSWTQCLTRRRTRWMSSSMTRWRPSYMRSLTLWNAPTGSQRETCPELRRDHWRAELLKRSWMTNNGCYNPSWEWQEHVQLAYWWMTMVNFLMLTKYMSSWDPRVISSSRSTALISWRTTLELRYAMRRWFLMFQDNMVVVTMSCASLCRLSSRTDASSWTLAVVMILSHLPEWIGWTLTPTRATELTSTLRMASHQQPRWWT